MKARVIQIGTETRVYIGDYKFAANATSRGFQAYRVDCWIDDTIAFHAETLWEVVEQVKKHCAKLKRQEKKQKGLN